MPGMIPDLGVIATNSRYTGGKRRDTGGKSRFTCGKPRFTYGIPEVNLGLGIRQVKQGSNI